MAKPFSKMIDSINKQQSTGKKCFARKNMVRNCLNIDQTRQFIG